MKALEIIFENQDLVALNKPAGLFSIPDRTQSEVSLKDMLIQKYGKIFTIHRLDKGTSGLIVFAKNEAAHQFLSTAFEGRQVEKYYLGLVNGIPAQESGTIDEPIAEHPAKNGKMVIYKKGKPSLTDYKVVETFGKYAWLSFQIHTGRTHQIRVHMKHIGHPIVCDELYGTGEPVYLSGIKRNFKQSRADEEERPLFHRLALHSHRLRFTDAQGRVQEWEAPLPKDMKALLQQLRKWNPSGHPMK